MAYWLREAKQILEKGDNTNDPDNAVRVLAKVGIRVYRDAERVTIDARTQQPVPLWWIAVSSTHPQLAEIFKGTHWKGRAGAPGTWAQALRGLDEGLQRAFQLRIDGHKNWVTPLLWETVFPPFNEREDADEIEAVDERDRNKPKAPG